MRITLICAICCLLGEATVVSQKSGKRRIPTVTTVNSELPLSLATCKISYSGYLEMDGGTKLTETEIGNFVNSNLREGYVLTIYPQSKSGIFVNMECPPTAPGHP